MDSHVVKQLTPERKYYGYFVNVLDISTIAKFASQGANELEWTPELIDAITDILIVKFKLPRNYKDFVKILTRISKIIVTDKLWNM